MKLEEFEKITDAIYFILGYEFYKTAGNMHNEAFRAKGDNIAWT